LTNRIIDRVDARATEVFETGVTHKFAQIFFREDKDLTGKRCGDPKNPNVTGFFGNR
jgi:hypothetical protein